ncbi:MAG: hypothetical protein UY69_C0028G0007 [Parcubacteria group bacterium GW2011_GWF1_52_5]|nr:MAG: hypothetical protein UY69_C0028G0007 [Parcubacteria group bacterium GW2011_GWF1_52_5]
MNIKVLRERVKVLGTNPLGRKSQLTFLPNADSATNDHSHKAWLWQRTIHNRVCVSTIESSLAQRRPRRIVLVENSTALEIIEHITPLRWFGILGLTLNGLGWPPYFGRSYEFYEALHRSLETTRQKVEWCTGANAVAFSHHDVFGGYSAFEPSHSPGLHIKISINYSGMGDYELCRNLPEDLHRLKDDMRAYTPGMPHGLYYLSSLGNALCVWKHHSHITWARTLKAQDALEQFAKHRLVDCLGALAFIHPSRLLAGSVVSICGNHSSDLWLIRMIQSELLDVEGKILKRASALAPSP